MDTAPNINVTLTAEDRGVSAAIKALSEQLKSLTVTQRNVAESANEAAVSEDRMAGSMQSARGAAALLGEETGVRLNRHLRSVLASSETLGPILQAAFPIAAAIGFGMILAQVAEKMSVFIADLLVYTADEKKAYDLEVQFNKELIRHVETVQSLNKQYERMGKNAVQLANMDVRELKDALAAANKKVDDMKANLTAPMPEAGLWAQMKGGLRGFLSGGVAGIGAGVAGAGADRDLAEQTDRELAVKKARDAQDEITLTLRNAQENRSIVTHEARDKEDKEREESNKRALEYMYRLYEAAVKEAEEEKKLAADLAQFWEKEDEKTTAAATKEWTKRVEADAKFRDQQEKNAMQQSLDQIALQEKAVEARGRRGAGGGGAAEEAAELEGLAQKKLDIEKAYLDARIREVTDRFLSDDATAYAQDLETYSRLLDEKRAANDKFLAAKERAEQMAADASPLKNLEKGLGKDIGNFFTEGIAHARSFGDAMRGLAQSVVASLQKMATQFIFTALQKRLLESSGGGGGGFFGFLSSVMGSAAGHAEGGMIEGPGGPKSDVIPAMLSSGEFVMSADAVKAMGGANLAAINRAAQTPAVSAGTLPHFAEGGLVDRAGGDSNINFGIGLDEGLILKHLSGKAAAGIIINHLVNNPKAAGKALARGT